MDFAAQQDTPLDPHLTQTTGIEPGPRVTLVRKLTDLVVMPAGKQTNNERAFTADLLIRALEQVDISVRAEAARRLAGFAEIPSQLQRYLVCEDIAVAGPILELTSTISPPVLIEASAISFAHRQVVAARDDVTGAVADALVSYGETPVIRELLKKEELTLSDNTMDLLVSRSQNDLDIRTLVMTRLELRLDHGMAMFWWLDSSQRQKILQRFALDRTLIQETMHPLFVEIFTHPDPDVGVKSILKLIDRRHRPRGRDGEMVTMDVVQKTLSAARQLPNDEFAHAVGLLAGVDKETASRVLHDWSGEAFAVLCKSIGLSRSDFITLIAGSGGGSGPEYDDAKQDQLIGVFDSIARDYSRTILRYWDWKGGEITEITPIEGPAVSEEEPAGSYFGAV